MVRGNQVVCKYYKYFIKSLLIKNNQILSVSNIGERIATKDGLRHTASVGLGWGARQHGFGRVFGLD